MNLGLAEHELIDATGNMFDPDSLLDRIAGPVRVFLREEALPSAQNLPPTEIFRIYETVCRTIPSNGL